MSSILEIIGNIEAELLELRKMVGVSPVTTKKLTDWRDLKVGDKLRFVAEHIDLPLSRSFEVGEELKVTAVEESHYTGSMQIMAHLVGYGLEGWVDMDKMLRKGVVELLP